MFLKVYVEKNLGKIFPDFNEVITSAFEDLFPLLERDEIIILVRYIDEVGLSKNLPSIIFSLRDSCFFLNSDDIQEVENIFHKLVKNHSKLCNRKYKILGLTKWR